MGKVFINYAHRGASHYAPENTMMAFYLGMQMGANGIETDVHRSKDGVIMLFHDDTLNRVTGQTGSISDYTLAELKQIDVMKGDLSDKIPTFEDFLEHFAFRDITFAIELKQPDVFAETADLIYRYGIENKTVITSFRYDEILKMRSYAPGLRTGYLTSVVTEELLTDMRKQGIGELCPKAELLTPENVSGWHKLGFDVRAWGISNEEIMRFAYDCGVDGMTVNFPDKLKCYIEEKVNAENNSACNR